MTLQQYADDLKAAVAARQMTVSAALDALVSEAETATLARPSPAQVIVRQTLGSPAEVEVKIDVNGANFDTASGLAKQLAARALAVEAPVGATAGASRPVGR
jgi:hypothetical protein